MSNDEPVSGGGHCGGCGGAPSGPCRRAFHRRGVRIVHWECWSRCNLGCSFCYRTRSVPLRGRDAELLLHVVAASGADAIAFAGGDPSLRRDLPGLCRLARGLGLTVEVQTNAHAHTRALLAALDHVDGVALSLDSGAPSVHDLLRAAPGNFTQNIRLLGLLDRRGIPTRVRTVVTAPNAESIVHLGELLSAYRCVTTWNVQELSAVGDGRRAHQRLHAPATIVDDVVSRVRQRYPRLACAAVTSTSKVGLYAMVRSDGTLYGTSGQLDDAGCYPTVGGMLDQHLAVLADRLPLDEAAHGRRYGRIGSRS